MARKALNRDGVRGSTSRCLLKAATSGHFEDSRNLFSMVHRQKTYGAKKSFINKGDEGLGQCYEHGQSIVPGGDIRQMGDADAKRLLSFALIALFSSWCLCGHQVVNKARVLRIKVHYTEAQD